MMEEQAPEQRVQNALSAEIPNLYVNGFTNNATLGDIMVVLEANGRPVGVLNMSYTVAKTFVIKMGALVKMFEERTGRPMLTIDDVAKILGRDEEQEANGQDRPARTSMPAAKTRKARKNGHVRQHA